MLRTLPLTGLLCDKHPLKEEVEQNKQLLLKNVPRSGAVIDVHGYPIETKSEHPKVFSTHSGDSPCSLYDVRNTGKSSDWKARENIQSVESAGKQKRRQQGNTKRGKRERVK